MSTEVEIGLAPNPATFNDKIMTGIREMINPLAINTVLDPFAGTGRIHELRPRYKTFGIELEPEWANHNHYADDGLTVVGDTIDCAIALANGTPIANSWPIEFDACITSPTYGNRMADHHEAKDGSSRNTYRHKLGRALTEGNSGMMQWGEEYRAFHAEAWASVTPLINHYFVLNIKDHVRGGKRMRVAQWHLDTLRDLGWRSIEHRQIDTRGNRYGANADLRIDYEYIILLGKPQ